MIMSNANWARPIDFFARRTNYIDHMAPIWLALDEEMRGSFYVPTQLVEHARQQGLEPVELRATGRRDILAVPSGDGPLVTCAFGDLQAAVRKNPRRPQIFMEHGVGLTFPHNGYAGGMGMRREVSLFLDPNEHTRALNKKGHPTKPGFVIGTPKLDKLFKQTWEDATRKDLHKGHKPIVCISFHWDGSRIAPEAGSAFDHYRSILPELAKSDEFTLIGHGHPRAMDMLAKYYQSCGIEPVFDFKEVLERADLYLNDCSSTLYEFCITDKPVIILNAPQFRRKIHYGIRFWEYTDVGPQVDRPEDLQEVIHEQLFTEEDPFELPRARAVQDLYPYWGCAAARAAEVIRDFALSKASAPKSVDKIHDESIGILYMSFGPRAASAVRKSMMSLRKIGLKIPICVVGDAPVQGAQFIEWDGQSPFDASERQNFQFRAGRIKPFLYDLTPFDRTLYIDADTEFMSNILKGFETLCDHDLALAEEFLSVGQLYNKPRAGWEINIVERDATITELGGDPDIKFLNSGVLFFRKSKAVKALFEAWGRQWLRWQQWDEQLALMRALHECPVKYEALSVDWNHPHRNKARIIFHNYGRGDARCNVN